MHATSDIHNKQLSQYQPLVTRMAYHMVSRLPASVDVDDLIQVGMIGLNDAISRCETSEGELEKFAKFRIRGAMIDELRELDWAPRQCRRIGRQIEAAVHLLQNRLCRRPTEIELAAELGMALEEFQSELATVYRSALVHLDDMDLLSSDDEDDDDHARSTPHPFGDWNADPLSVLQRDRQQIALSAAILALPSREQEVMALHYTRDMKFKEIGNELGVCESRVCQIHRHAVELLKAQLNSH